MRSLALTVFLLLLMSSFSTLVLADTFVVEADGSGTYATIQDALDECVDGDVVVLMPGTYTGPGNRDFEIYDSITVRSFSDNHPAIIDCQGSAGDWHRGFQVEEGTTSLKDLVIRNGFVPNGGAIIINGGLLTMDHCQFENNTATENGGALYAFSWGDVTALSCVFSDNTAYLSGGAVFSRGATTSVKLFNCTLFRNEAPDGSGVFLSEDGNCRLNSTIIAFGIDGSACSDYYGGDYIFGCSNMYANEGGDWVGSLASELLINNNTNVDPMFCDPMGSPANFGIMPASPLGSSHPCGPLGAVAPDPAWPAPVYGLTPNGYGMYPNIQAAIDSVPAGAVISLEDGTYIGLGNHDMDFSGKAVSLTSRNQTAASAIIDIQGSAAHPQRGFWIHSGETVATSISHLTIRNGYTTDYDQIPYPGSGGAIVISNMSDLSVLDVTFENNRATAQGAAIRIIGTGAILEITDSRFTGHISNYCISASGCGLVMDNCQIDDTNTGGVIMDGRMIGATVNNSQLRPLYVEGLKIWNAINSITVDNCDFVARLGHNGLASIQDSKFWSNSSANGGAIAGYSSQLTVLDSEITGNTATAQGGIYLTLCTPVLVDHCLVANNTASFKGSGIGINYSDLTISSSTIVGNGGLGSTGQVFIEANDCTVDISESIIGFSPDSPAMRCINPTYLTLTTSCLDVFGNAGGDWVGPLGGLLGVSNNISADPIFCDMPDGIFTVAYTSACASGNNACGSDIGAYPAACSAVTGTPEPELPNCFKLLGNSPNPFNPQTDIAFEVPTSGAVKVEVFAANGRLVRRLVQGDTYAPGAHRVTWDGNDDAGRGQSSGIYFYRVQTSGQSLGGKMTLIR